MELTGEVQPSCAEFCKESGQVWSAMVRVLILFFLEAGCVQVYGKMHALGDLPED